MSTWKVLAAVALALLAIAFAVWMVRYVLRLRRTVAALRMQVQELAFRAPLATPSVRDLQTKVRMLETELREAIAARAAASPPPLPPLESGGDTKAMLAAERRAYESALQTMNTHRERMDGLVQRIKGEEDAAAAANAAAATPVPGLDEKVDRARALVAALVERLTAIEDFGEADEVNDTIRDLLFAGTPVTVGDARSAVQGKRQIPVVYLGFNAFDEAQVEVLSPAHAGIKDRDEEFPFGNLLRRDDDNYDDPAAIVGEDYYRVVDSRMIELLQDALKATTTTTTALDEEAKAMYERLREEQEEYDEQQQSIRDDAKRYKGTRHLFFASGDPSKHPAYDKDWKPGQLRPPTTKDVQRLRKQLSDEHNERQDDIRAGAGSNLFGDDPTMHPAYKA